MLREVYKYCNTVAEEYGPGGGEQFVDAEREDGQLSHPDMLMCVFVPAKDLSSHNETRSVRINRDIPAGYSRGEEEKGGAG